MKNAIDMLCCSSLLIWFTIAQTYIKIWLWINTKIITDHPPTTSLLQRSSLCGTWVLETACNFCCHAVVGTVTGVHFFRLSFLQSKTEQTLALCVINSNYHSMSSAIHKKKFWQWSMIFCHRTSTSDYTEIPKINVIFIAQT